MQDRDPITVAMSVHKRAREGLPPIKEDLELLHMTLLTEHCKGLLSTISPLHEEVIRTALYKAKGYTHD